MTDTKRTPATGTPNTAVAPELTTQVEEAPGRGILPNISLHLAGTTHLFHLDAQPIERINDLLYRQYLHGTNLTFVKWIAKKGAVVPLNHHVNEQVSWITEGRCEVYSDGKKYTMKAGDIMILPLTFHMSLSSLKTRSTSRSSLRGARIGLTVPPHI